MARKKEKSTLPLLMGAIAFGIAAALLSMFYLKSERAALLASLKGPEYSNVAVVVATSDLPKGTVISADNFAIAEFPENFVHSDAVDPDEFDSYQGRSLTENLGYGQSLLRSFMDESFPVDFSDIIPKGHRAMTVTVDEINSIAGQIRPGNRIDILVNIPYSASGFNPTAIAAGTGAGMPAGLAELIPANLLNLAPDLIATALAAATPPEVIIPVVQNMRVLATGKDAYNETLDELRQPQHRRDSTYTNLTLDVTVQQAALLTTAQDNGELLALLRNRGDDSSADFTSLSARDLFDNARKMAREEAKRKAAASIPAGVDENGNLVNANGDTIMSKEQLAAAGYTLNENGEIVDKDGNVIDPGSLVVGANGEVMTKEQLAAAGFKVNENGEIVDANGNIVDPSNIVVSSDGTVITRDQLAAAGYSVNENGEIVDANGKIVDPNEILISADGSVMTKAQLDAAGLSINENGEIVDKDGNVVDVKDIVIAADGSVMTKAQLDAAGLSINENGEIVDKNGNVVDPDDIIMGADGSIITRQELEKAGLRVNENGEIVDKNGKVVSGKQLASKLGRPELANAGSFTTAEARAAARGVPTRSAGATAVDMIIGGASEDGVSKIGKLPINE